MKIQVRDVQGKGLVECVYGVREGRCWRFSIGCSIKRPRVFATGGDEKGAIVDIEAGRKLAEVNFAGRWDMIAEGDKWTVEVMLYPRGLFGKMKQMWPKQRVRRSP